MDEKLKIFIVSGSDMTKEDGGYGEEAHIVVAKSKKRAMELVCWSEEDFKETGLDIEEFIVPDYEYCECICSYYGYGC